MHVLHTKNSIKAIYEPDNPSYEDQRLQEITISEQRFFCFTKMAKYDLCENFSSDLLVCSMSPSREDMETNYCTCYTCIHFKVHFY